MTLDEYDFARYLNVRTFHGASFSPDSTSLSFLCNITGTDEVWSVPIGKSSPLLAWPDQLTFGGERIIEATFSPCEDILLVAGDTGGNERSQLYILTKDASTWTALTTRPEVIYNFGGWSPDGEEIIYSSNERDPRYFDIYRYHIEHKKAQCVFQQNGLNHAIGYAPDGKHIIVTHYQSSSNNQLLLINIDTTEVTELTEPTTAEPSSYGAIAWSKKTQGLYLLSNHGRQFFSLAYLDIATKRFSYLIDTTWDNEGLALSHDGNYIALISNENGYSRLEVYDISDGWDQRQKLNIPELPAGVITEPLWSPDGNMLALTINCSDDPQAIWIWDRTANRLWRATQKSTAGIPQATLVRPSLIHYPTFDDREIPALLYRPANSEQAAPTIIYPHGGPAGQSRAAFNPIIQYFVGHGYCVCAPNVRGSAGYGYDYQSLDDIYLRMDSVTDLYHAYLWLTEQGIADPQQIAVMGTSYGGFMTLAAVTTYPDLWAAGISIVGIANFITFLEQTGPWRRKMREKEYGSLENDRAFLEQISPISSVDRVKTPMFIVHGANDPRVPVGEAEQIVSALQARHIPVEYLRFSDEGHGIIKRANRLIAYPAIARFLESHMK